MLLNHHHLRLPVSISFFNFAIQAIQISQLMNYLKYLFPLAIILATFLETVARENICVPVPSVPMEKVYLHLDNTSYCKGDKVWFKAYVVNAFGNTHPSVSQTLYVDLLNPGGELIQRKIYKVENGQAAGDFVIDHLPFYSGYYEVRAYTKYMLNFGDENYFSRVIPVFDDTLENRTSSSTKLSKRVKLHFKDFRKSSKNAKRLNLKFFPEGGSLVKGILSRVAFEVTDENGYPLYVRGVIKSADSMMIDTIEVLHDGKGVLVIFLLTLKRMHYSIIGEKNISSSSQNH